MVHSSRAYTRLLNSLIDARIACAGRRSPWFHMSPGERTDYLLEVERRLLEIQHTTLNVLAAQHFTMAENPRSIDQHLDALNACRERLERDGSSPAGADYRLHLDSDIRLYRRQQLVMRGFEQAWRKALKLLQAGNGLHTPCAGLLPRLQRLTRLARRKVEEVGPDAGLQRLVLFARAQGWHTLTERYRALLDVPAVDNVALAALSEVPQASDELPVNLSLLLMEERAGYLRLTMALVDPCYDGRYKDLYLERGKLALQARGVMHVSFGTAARALAWQQHYRLKQEPGGGQSPTFAPIRSVLVRSRFVMDLLGLFAVSEHSQRSGFFSQVFEQGVCLRVVNVDRKVPNQLGLRLFAEPHGGSHRACADLPERLSELLERSADLSSFQTIAEDSYATSHYEPDRDGTFLSIRHLERGLGFGERLYLLELPLGRRYLAATPFGLLDVEDSRAGSRHLSVAQVHQAYLHNEAFFCRLEQLRKHGESVCRWLASPRQRQAFEAQWLRLLERNHLTPGGVLPTPPQLRDSLRDIKGNALGKVRWEQAFAEAVWSWPETAALLFDLGRVLASRVSLTWLEDPYLQHTLARARQLLADVLPPMAYRPRARRLLQLLLGAETPGVLDSEQGRDLRQRALCQVLLLLVRQAPGRHRPVNAHEALGDQPASGRLDRPDPCLLLNSRPDLLQMACPDGVIAEDKYRGYHRFGIDPDSATGAYMDELDVPFTGGLSAQVEALCRNIPELYARLPGLQTYWRLQLAICAFLLRNGYHSFFETIYLAARYEPALPGAVGARLLALFDRCRQPQTGSGVLYRGAAELVLVLVNQGLSQERHLHWPSLDLYGLRTSGEADRVVLGSAS